MYQRELAFTHSNWLYLELLNLDTASLHAPKLLDVAGIPLGTATPGEVVAASVNIGAHETLHLLGTRHHDAFFPIGTGVSFGEGGADWEPAFPGPEGAALTSMEFNGLTTSFGPLSASALLSTDLFIGPRSAVKLLHDTFVDLDVDSADANSPMSPQALTLKTIPLPNNLPPSDAMFGFDLFADVVIVEEASIEPDDMFPVPESDYYSITGDAGDLFFIEVISEVTGSGDSVDSVVALLDPTLGLTPVPWFTGGAFNDDERESPDSLILDVTLPSSGTFVIEVFSSMKAGNELGDYEMLVYRMHGVPEPSSLALALFSFIGTMGYAVRRRQT